LHANWRDITARGSFDLSKVFGAETAKQAVRVQLYFVKAFGCKLLEDGIRVDLGSFSEHSAVWMNLVHPVGIKICYLKAGAPVREPPGFPWHPTRQRKLVKLSPYKGDTEPLVARRDLRI
jgi:hypothetical protein